MPGIWLQKITTKQPDDSMIEIAICSMQEALAANGDTAPAGSWDPAREPIPEPGELAKEMEARIEAEESDDQAEATGPTTATPDSLAPEAAPGVDVAETPPTRPGGATEGA
jgi:hypothetical protein